MIDTRHIFVDADACPVKEEVYKVAFRPEVRVSIVSNMMMRVPVHPLVTRIVVGSGLDAADDWIAERASSTQVVIPAVILLADRCRSEERGVAKVCVSPCRSRWRPY